MHGWRILPSQQHNHASLRRDGRMPRTRLGEMDIAGTQAMRADMTFSLQHDELFLTCVSMRGHDAPWLHLEKYSLIPARRVLP